MIASSPLHIVVVGVGLIGPRHCEHIKKNPSTELFAIVDPLPQAEEVADRFSTDYYSSVRDMIQHLQLHKLPYPDGAIVCTPNHTHIKVAAELASFGIHLLVEKPLSSSAPELQALQRYTRHKGVKLLVGHHRRFNPFIVETKKSLHRVGDVIAIQGTWALRKPASYFKASPWRTSTKTGGGALLINLVHDIDLLQYLFGPVEKVYAELMKKQRSGYPDVDEGACLTLRFKNGITGTFICSDNVTSPFSFESGTGENPTVPFHDGLEGFYRVFGSKGTLSVPDMSLYHQPGEKEELWLAPVERESLVEDRHETLYSTLPFDLQLEHFVEVIRGKAEPLCTADDGMASLLCIDAVLRSTETGLPQYVEEVLEVEPDYSVLGVSLSQAKQMD